MTVSIRKRLFAAASALSALMVATSVSAQTATSKGEAPTVEVQSGKLAGVVLESGVRAYLDVPYAAPPVGDLRWRDPQPVKPWNGVYHAERKAAECIQVLRPHLLNHYFGEEPTSEDCLYLNVWTPPAGTAASGKLPVVAFIHGGGFTIGSSGMALYDGAEVAAKGVIFVSFNYRLGALGFMAHPQLDAESADHTSGDYALMDEVAALKWIKANIAAFGGDPDNVTLSGQSAGAISIGYLQVSPLAQGLFHKGFAMSGSPVRTFPLQDKATAEAAGLAIQKALGAASVADMRQLPADKILALQSDCQLGCSGAIRVGPSIDGRVFPKSPAELLAAMKTPAAPMVLGFTREESQGPLRRAQTVAEYEAAARAAYGAASDKLLKLYPARTDADIPAAAASLSREVGMELGMRSWAQALAATGDSHVYLYMFSRTHPYAPGVTFLEHDPKKVGAYHTGDVPYVLKTQWALNSLRTTRNWTPLDVDLAEKMSDALVAFARTGDPSTSGLAWPEWSPRKERLMEFGDRTGVAAMDAARLDFAASLPAPAPSAVPATNGPIRPRD